MAFPNFPVTITILRLALAPVIAVLIALLEYAGAAVIFVIAASSDVVDGVIARRYALVSELGARLDPVADKAVMLAAALTLAWQGLLPVWLAAAIVIRDAVVLSGAIAFRFVAGRLEMAPTWLSKFNTALEFTVLGAVLLTAAGLLDFGRWLPALFVAVLVTIVTSGVQYVWVWAHKAAAARCAGGG
ncbi:MAG: CDP-alcohol phosphatidyltransferase family protein [Burkholderiales bacterium]|nr:CDP-alcohol phosphatidyltransferase family protein [Burkholderiales bacterium]